MAGIRMKGYYVEGQGRTHNNNNKRNNIKYI